MQLMFVHSDYLEYEVKRQTKVAEEIEDAQKSGRMDDVLAVFIAVEKEDEGDIDAVVDDAVSEIREVSEKVNTDRIVLYPYAHLSSSLSSPDTAVYALKRMEEILKDDFDLMRAPFGWYKAFSIRCKGHPLSELSRTIRPVEKLTGALEAEEKAVSRIMVLTPDGDIVEPEKFDFGGYDGLKAFFDYEISKNRVVDIPPPHVELMRRLELADYEEGSDPGNLRYYPNGRLIKGLLEELVLSRSVKSGAMEVETPIMYDSNHPTLKKYLERFPARQYRVIGDKKDKELFLRFAACFGQFLMNHDMSISYRNLPLKMIELTRYSFRREQRGELVGLRRLRSFTMPDMHTLCKDMDEAIREFEDQYRMCIDVLAEIGLESSDYEVGIRFTQGFYDENRDFINGLAAVLDKPVLVEIWDERFFYFVLKFEFNFIDCLGKASALSTVQIDVENAGRYGITYIDSENAKVEPTILHCSPSGAIERCIYALLERASMDTESGVKLPMLPFWLSPTQVRIIPVSDQQLDYAVEIASRLPFRVDIDDRDETVGKKVRSAGREWVPYVVVIGEREREEGVLTVTVRKESSLKKPKRVKMTVDELKKMLEVEQGEMPYKPLSLPVLLSRRPRFVGKM
ncbi:MAG: threonine--tRNA ligase [Candidatus Syntrophoarchaeum sp.]|nr:threonine--tRNA ligase [Candidatus Syntrophoarchaeum sp.]